MATRNTTTRNDDDGFEFAETTTSGRGAASGRGRPAKNKLPELTDEEQKYFDKYLEQGSCEADANRMARVRSLMDEEAAVKGQSGIWIDGFIGKDGPSDKAFASRTQYEPQYSTRGKFWYYRITVNSSKGDNLGTPSGNVIFLDKDDKGYFCHFITDKSDKDLVAELDEREEEYAKSNPTELLGFLSPRGDCEVPDKKKDDKPAEESGRSSRTAGRTSGRDAPAAETPARGGRGSRSKADAKVVDMLNALIELVGQEAFDLALDEITK